MSTATRGGLAVMLVAVLLGMVGDGLLRALPWGLNGAVWIGLLVALCGLLAWRLGLALAGGRVSVWALRSGFIALFAGSTWLLARLASRFYGPRAGVLAAFALNVSGYFGLAAGTFALPDGPLLFFWLLTLDRLASVPGDGARLGPWIGVGLAWGGALLSKYHAALLPLGAGLYLALEPSARPWLRRPGPYVALAVGLAVFIMWTIVGAIFTVPPPSSRWSFARWTGAGAVGGLIAGALAFIVHA